MLMYESQWKNRRLHKERSSNPDQPECDPRLSTRVRRPNAEDTQ